MDKFNNSNSSLALQKFYNHQNQNHDIRILELQQRLKTEKIMCQIEMSKLNNVEKVINEEQVINEVKDDKSVVEKQVINEILDNEIIQFDTVYQSNENFET